MMNLILSLTGILSFLFISPFAFGSCDGAFKGGGDDPAATSTTTPKAKKTASRSRTSSSKKSRAKKTASRSRTSSSKKSRATKTASRSRTPSRKKSRAKKNQEPLIYQYSLGVLPPVDFQFSPSEAIERLQMMEMEWAEDKKDLEVVLEKIQGFRKTSPQAVRYLVYMLTADIVDFLPEIIRRFGQRLALLQNLTNLIEAAEENNLFALKNNHPFKYSHYFIFENTSFIDGYTILEKDLENGILRVAGMYMLEGIYEREVRKVRDYLYERIFNTLIESHELIIREKYDKIQEDVHLDFLKGTELFKQLTLLDDENIKPVVDILIQRVQMLIDKHPQTFPDNIKKLSLKASSENDIESYFLLGLSFYYGRPADSSLIDFFMELSDDQGGDLSLQDVNLAPVFFHGYIEENVDLKEARHIFNKISTVHAGARIMLAIMNQLN